MHHIILIMFCSTLLLTGIVASLAKNRFRVIDINQEEIVIRKFRKNVNIMWRDVKAICPEFHKPSTINFLLIETLKRDTYAIKIAHNSVILDEIYDKMLREIKRRDINVYGFNFHYPDRIEKTITKKKIVLSLATIILLILSVGRFLQIGIHLSDPTFFLITPLVCLGFILIVKLNKDIHIKSLYVNDYKIKLYLKDNDIPKCYEYSDIKNCKLYKFHSFIEFDDGVCIKGLDKLYYWPLLREHLISKLGNAISD